MSDEPSNGSPALTEAEVKKLDAAIEESSAAKVETLKAMVRHAEWGGPKRQTAYHTLEPTCPWCYQVQSQNHKVDCRFWEAVR